MPHGRRRTNGFVRRLRFLLLFICIGRFRNVLLTVFLGDVLAHFCHSVGANAGGIGTHVGDQSDEAFLAKFHAFVQALRNHHRALDAEAQFARRILLQFAGREGRRRVAPAFLFLRRAYNPVCFLKRCADCLRIFPVVDFNFLLALADKARVKGRRFRGCEMRVDRPIFFLLERLDLAFALDDQTQRDCLHASGGQSAANFVPQQRGNLVADNSVQYAPGLLCIYQIAIDVARVLKGGPYRALRDFVKRHSTDALRVFCLRFLVFFFFLPSPFPVHPQGARRWLRLRDPGQAPGKSCRRRARASSASRELFLCRE